MIAKRFQSFRRLGAGTAAAMGLYIVTSQVAAERAELERVERRIVQTRQDIRQLQTEMGTRASLRQLERWNGEVLALTTPQAGQFMRDQQQLASFDAGAVATDVQPVPGAVMLAAATTTREPTPAAAAPRVAPPASGRGEVAPVKLAAKVDPAAPVSLLAESKVLFKHAGLRTTRATRTEFAALAPGKLDAKLLADLKRKAKAETE